MLQKATTLLSIVILFVVCSFPVPTCAQSNSGQDVSNDGIEKSEPVSLNITLKNDGQKIVVQVGKELFCQFQYAGVTKPMIYPIELKPGLSLTRNYPMKKVTGEANDHPHHMSLWMGHEISGIDFWTNRTGKIAFQKIEDINESKGQFTVVNSWQRKANAKTMLIEKTTYRFGANKDSRWIAANISFTAEEDVVFEDTKEGLFAIRTHPNLRLSPDPKRGVEQVTGQAVNDSGVQGKPIWGKPAKWVDYHGRINGQPVGITMFDHPSNLRHPTTWHAREYGLVAANPFGLHYFANGPKRAGEVELKKGETLNLIYGVRFYEGTFDANKSESSFQEFAAETWTTDKK